MIPYIEKLLDSDEWTCEADSFCDFVPMLLQHPEVGRALALADARFGLNLQQWSMRDVVLAKAEGLSKF